MTVPELRTFLLRHDVVPSAVPRSDGTRGPPRKTDLYSQAMIIRRAHIAAFGGEPAPSASANPDPPDSFRAVVPLLASERADPPAPLQAANPFQQGNTPPKPAATPSASRVDGGGAARSSVVSPPRSKKTPSAKRRSSVGWINPQLMQAMQTPSSRYPAASTVAAAVTPAPPQVLSAGAGARGASIGVTAGGSAYPYAQSAPQATSEEAILATAAAEVRRLQGTDSSAGAGGGAIARAGFESEGDEIVPSDGDAVSGESSAGGLSDADSTFTTDGEDTDDEKIEKEQFHQYRVVELKAYLSKRKVTFPARAKKAELVAMARAHVTYLEGLQPPSRANMARPIAPAPPPLVSAGPATLYAGNIVTQPQRSAGAPGESTGASGQGRPAASVTPSDGLPAVAAAGRATGSKAGRASAQGLPPKTGSPANNSTRRPFNRKLSAPSTGPDLLNDVPIDVDAIEPAAASGVGVPSARPMRRRKEDVPDGRKVQTKPRKETVPVAARPAKRAGYRMRMPALPRMSPRDCARFMLAFVIFLFWIVSCASLYNVYLVSLRPFCDTSASSDRLDDGRPCRPCPQRGVCSDGDLTCEPGYRRVDSRCTEDHEVALYADNMASYSANVLRDLAGRKECGEKVVTVLTRSKLHEMLRPAEKESDGLGAPQHSNKRASYSRRSRRSGSQYDSSKFTPAFSKAMDAFDMEDNPYDVRRVFGGYESTQPYLPLGCVARRFVFRNWRFFSSFITITVLYLYLSLRRQRLRKHKLKILDICDGARSLLLEQVVRYGDGIEEHQFLIDTHLRDEILGNSQLAVKLWKEAEFELARDTRVRKSGPKTVKGHPCYIWEWVARQDQPLQPKGRSSFGSTTTAGRSSWGSGASTPHGRLSMGSTPGRSPWSAQRSPLYADRR